MSGTRTGRKPRVLLLAAAAATSGGGEKHVVDLMRRLPEAGVAVALACPAGGDLGSVARRLGVAVFEVPIANGFTPAKVAAVRRVIEATQPDVVHAHGSRAAAFARLADARAAQRVVYTLHGIHVGQAGTTTRRAGFLAIERLLRPRTARFITVCEADSLKGQRMGVLDPKHTTTIHNGIDISEQAPPRGRFRREAGVSDDAPLVLSVGRYHEQKDQGTLLHAWQRLTASHPDAVLALIGSGGLEVRLRSMARALGIATSVRLLPPRASLDDAYVDADVFVLSSRWEGLPYVILEAMSHGIPVASTDVDGIPEAVLDGVTGLLVPPSQPAALSAALSRLLEDSQLRARLGAAGRVRVTQKFSLESMVDMVAALYREVAG